MKSFLREFLIEIIIVTLFVVTWFTAIVTFEIFETSMEPNFHEGQRVIVLKAAYWDWIGEPRRGDVIVLKAPGDSTDDFIKRIVGIPGDTVEAVKGQLYVNGVKLSEPYLKNSFSYTMTEVKIPEKTYFVLGDNRDISNDSHRFGPLPEKNIIGKVAVVYWPPGSWKLVPKFDLGKQLVPAK